MRMHGFERNVYMVCYVCVGVRLLAYVRACVYVHVRGCVDACVHCTHLKEFVGIILYLCFMRMTLLVPLFWIVYDNTLTKVYCFPCLADRWVRTDIAPNSGAAVLEVDIPTGYHVKWTVLQGLRLDGAAKVRLSKFVSQRVVMAIEYVSIVTLLSFWRSSTSYFRIFEC